LSAIIQTYRSKLSTYQSQLEKVNKQLNLIVTVRLVLAAIIVLFIYLYFKQDYGVYILLGLAGLIGFIYLIKLHSKHNFNKKRLDALVRVNQEEIDFLAEEKLPFDMGLNYLEPNHFYAHDLDIFGPKSLYQNLNRTHLKSGADQLSEYLLNLPTSQEIRNRQNAINELGEKLDWRQQYSASCITTEEKEETLASLLNWAKKDLTKPSNTIRMAAFVLPIALFVSIALNYFLPDAIFGSFIKPLIISNLLVAFSQAKYIKNELIHSASIKNTLKSYSLLIEQIEQETFESEKLTLLQADLIQEKEKVSHSIKKLAKIYAGLENINNPFGAALLNAFILYHVHAFYKLKVWKKQNAHKISVWMDVLGEFEALNSLANLSYNNPNFVFPQLNAEEKLEFKELGHPLINAMGRIANDINYNGFKFIILTGSNMSGKSTFLRSLGINMVLVQAGAPVCASEANVHPMPILVSMRVSDSLGEGESFFFAEVKRLKQIMVAAQKETSYVLLDEILRGTNSDDKRTGTVEVIKSILAKNAYGAIATHDLKVCDTTSEYPMQLTNKCFEVEIENNELVFDYKLIEGVCKNKSATFLMKKMGVI